MNARGRDYPAGRCAVIIVIVPDPTGSDVVASAVE